MLVFRKILRTYYINEPLLSICKNIILYLNHQATKFSPSIKILTLFRIGISGAAHGWGEEAKRLSSLKSVTHILKYMNHVTHLFISADINIFSPEIRKFGSIKKCRYRLYFDA